MLLPEKILLVCPSVTKRLEYIVRFVSARLGIDMKMIPESQFTISPGNPGQVVVHYGRDSMEGVFSIFDSGLLFETTITIQETGVFRNQMQVMLFPAPEGFDLPFDIFSASFYLLSRYEEYLPYIPDRLGRFEANQSLAHFHGFLEEPVIDQWIELLKSKLQHEFPKLEFPVRKFRFISTFDIDNPWAYLHKGFFRTSAGLMKALLYSHVTDFQQRIKVLGGKIPDPFDTYQFIIDMEIKYHFKSLFFLLFAKYGGYDTNYALETVHFKKLALILNTDRSLGIHPSYKSAIHNKLLYSEHERFFEVLGHKPQISRQHFLMLSLPETYRQLISMGIREDYSMGYASFSGYRAGTCTPFFFYDLARECGTELLIFPFAVMDVTYRQYLSLSPEVALERILSIADRVKKVNGTFTSLWHNESLSEYGIWKGWRQVFEGMVREVTGENKE